MSIHSRDENKKKRKLLRAQKLTIFSQQMLAARREPSAGGTVTKRLQSELMSLMVVPPILDLISLDVGSYRYFCLSPRRQPIQVGRVSERSGWYCL